MIEINPEETPFSEKADVVLRLPAAEALMRFAQDLSGRGAACVL